MEFAHVIVQDGLPLAVVAVAATWLLRRWLRPSPSACAGCSMESSATAPVRHRLPVLGARR